MNSDIEKVFQNIVEQVDNIKFVDANDIPNIDLYMDQVTTFIDRALNTSTKSKDSNEKLLTKTMINNYAKNGLLPSPVKKKYNKEHVIVLVFIYYFKNILSFSDIKALLQPVTDKYFGKNSKVTLDEIYTQVENIEKKQIHNLEDEIIAKYSLVESSFDAEEDREFLQMFLLICTLILDVYSKKKLIEKMIKEFADKYGDKYGDKEEHSKKTKNKK